MERGWNIKSSAIDLPLSQKVFSDHFPVQYQYQDNFKCTVSVSDLNDVFGENWHIYQFPNSITRKRILGMVTLHFRRKGVGKKLGTDSRYLKY